jgi:hypothetical protein
METIGRSGEDSVNKIHEDTIKAGTSLNKNLTGSDGAGAEEKIMPFSVLNVQVHVSKTK